MIKLLSILVLGLTLSGCMTVQVPVVEPWEGRYDTMEECVERVQGETLREG